jgi:hypothetical protein
VALHCKKSGSPLTTYYFIVKSRENYGTIFLNCLVQSGLCQNSSLIC